MAILWWKTLHILAAVWLAAGVFASAVVFAVLKRASDPAGRAFGVRLAGDDLLAKGTRKMVGKRAHRIVCRATRCEVDDHPHRLVRPVGSPLRQRFTRCHIPYAKIAIATSPPM